MGRFVLQIQRVRAKAGELKLEQVGVGGAIKICRDLVHRFTRPGPVFGRIVPSLVRRLTLVHGMFDRREKRTKRGKGAWGRGQQ